MTLASGTEVTVQDGQFIFGGAVDTTASGTTGDALGLVLNDALVVTDSGAITTGAVTLNGNGGLDSTLLQSPSGGAAITVTGNVTDGPDNAFAFSVFGGSDAGDVDLQGTVTVGSLFVRSGNALTLNDVTTTGNTVRARYGREPQWGHRRRNGSADRDSGGSLTQFVEVVDPNADVLETTGQGSIVRADTGSVILGARDEMTINLVEAASGDITLALLGPATTDGSGDSRSTARKASVRSASRTCPARPAWVATTSLLAEPSRSCRMPKSLRTSVRGTTAS